MGNTEADPSQADAQRSPAWLRIGLFLSLYSLIQWAYQSLRSSSFDPWFIHTMTVQPAAGLIDLLVPSAGVAAVGPKLEWAGGSLTLLAGCDGFEVMGLFIAAMLVADVNWRRGLVSLTFGCLAIWGLNQLRIAALYWAFVWQRDWFDAIHTAWGPVLLIIAVAGIYVWVTRLYPWRNGRVRATA